jgi:hypothetical protein
VTERVIENAHTAAVLRVLADSHPARVCAPYWLIWVPKADVGRGVQSIERLPEDPLDRFHQPPGRKITIRAEEIGPVD